MKFPYLFLSMLLSGTVCAAANQDMAALEKLADRFMQQEVSQRQASYKLGRLDRRLVLPACSSPKVDWSNTAQTSGNTSLVIVCPDSGWSIRLPVTVSEKQLGVVLTRSVAAGEVLQAGDVKLVEMANPAMARNVINSVDLAVGQSMRSGAPAGSWLRNFMVHAPYAVRAGQPVKVSAGGDGFSVLSEGTANGNAAVGEAVSVRLSSGRVVRGMVQPDGTVSLSY
ncbi:flagellar basal body P-ring formation chaperone FlgA [Aquitalea magnusonii]|uniref:Flagella basal body P-ring formation protein FlgA n=1 Tax=Aquitalea magnusonii TaxID=332411 RepID=A0A318JHH0_9NEIS|nr:flagellar basal body P-ring formation chaperone FlgA [Aquitalea magnusonii]PXX48054.1 flagella basal body P-ring formation protein FlgA [Aquitalea magnusonii]